MTAAREPRAAIIGAGLMGRWHADAVRRIGGRVSLIVDPDETARVSLGRRFPGARLAATLEPQLVAETSTAAHICSPLSTHSPLVNALVDVGVDVLVEKPFAETADATRALLARARDRGVIACPVHQFLFQDGLRELRAWLPELGVVRRLQFAACSAGADGAGGVGLDDLIAEILPHPLSIASLVLGCHVSDGAWQILHPAPGELQAMTTFGETIVSLSISAHGRPTENLVRVVADLGSATVDLFHGFAVRHDGEVSRSRKITQPFAVSARTIGVAGDNLVRRALRSEPAYPGLRALVRAFYAAVASRAESPIRADAILDVAEARDALLAALGRFDTARRSSR